MTEDGEERRRASSGVSCIDSSEDLPAAVRCNLAIWFSSVLRPHTIGEEGMKTKTRKKRRTVTESNGNVFARHRDARP
jgi:hypothetical protein